jgi:putative nucleotidyltransferase with HDIG domain
MDITKNREFCLSILKDYTKSDSLLKHAFAVETCVKAYAEKFNEDVEYWGNVALLHDFDYEKFPMAEEHPFKGAEILKEKDLMKILLNQFFRMLIIAANREIHY